MMANSVVLLATGVSYKFAMMKRQIFENTALKMELNFIRKAAI